LSAERPSDAPPRDRQALRGRRQTWIEVDLDALAWNLKVVRAHLSSRCRILAVVKADAYGHGAIPVCRKLASEGVDALGVATTEEGVTLRAAGVATPILVLGPADREQIASMVESALTPAISTPASLDAVVAEAARRDGRIPIHLKVDTGMGRLGLLPDQMAGALATLERARDHVLLEGIFTHLACADDPDDPFTRGQLECFDGILARVREAGFRPQSVHAANSGAILHYPESWFDTVRPGILLYGAHPSPRARRLDLRPVISFRSRLVQVKELPAGSSVGYGRAYVTRRPGPIGIVPAGYADGLSRALAETGGALVAGRLVPYAGRISMDYATLDLASVPGAREGDEVVLLGRQQDQIITADAFASWAGTIPYEALCGIGPRVPRLYLQAGVLCEGS
jgi:alanine racemase